MSRLLQISSWEAAGKGNGPPARRTISPAVAVVPARNEEATIAGVVRELRSLPEVDAVVVVANGSTDRTPDAARKAGARVLHYPEPVGYDVARALGVRAFPAAAYLFTDGDIVLAAGDLRPFLAAVAAGVDVALNDLEGLLSDRGKLHSVSVAKRFLNLALGRRDLGCNSLTAVPHALSGKAVRTVGHHALAVPPLAQALAIRSGLTVKAVHPVDVVTSNRVHRESSFDEFLSAVILGDHLEALAHLFDARGRRLEQPDGFRRRDMILPVPRILEAETPAGIAPPPRPPREGADPSFDRGYDRGFDAGADLAWEVGFQDGVGALFPDRLPLPLTCGWEDVLARGVDALRKEGGHAFALSVGEAFSAVRTALGEGRGYAVVRVGDSDIRFLAHGRTASFSGSFARSAGVEHPAPEAQRDLARAVARADLLGVPISHQEEYRALLFDTLPLYGLKPSELRMTEADCVYLWHGRGLLRDLLLAGPVRPRVLLVGNAAPALEPVLRREGVEVAGAVAPVNGLGGVADALERVAAHRFDLALVGAGTAAIPINAAIARDLGKVAVDVGDLADHLARGIRRL